MKKYILIFFIAVLIGIIFSNYIFKGIDKTFALTKDNEEVVLYQVGVFKNYENAIICSNEHPESVIINEGDLYRVYIGIAIDKEVQLAYKNYFAMLDINYYEQKKHISNRCAEEIKKYEELIKKSFDSGTYQNINKKLLKYYKDECHD